jgi:micrococcal nuclease
MFGGVLVKVVAGVVAAAGVTTAVVVGVASGGGPDEGVVAKVVDGDTVDVVVGGSEQRVRLLNIDTPESVDPARPVGCLALEATAFLRGLLPVGAPVRLEYDDVRTDRYDRTLAGIFTTDGALVNAEIARAGLAAVVVFDDNDRFLPPVEAARGEAEAASVGLYSADVTCTVPAQLAVLEAVPAVADPAADAPSDEFTAAAAALSDVVASADRLENVLRDAGRPGLAVFGQADLQRFIERVQAIRNPATAQRSHLQSTVAQRARAEAAEARAEAARAEAARAEAERQAERARAAAEAEAAREAERRRERAAEQERSRPAPAPTGGSGGDGYTGPRCYAPGGLTYTPC